MLPFLAQAGEVSKAPVPNAAPAAATHVVLTKDNMLTINDEFNGQTVAAIQKQAKEMDARIPSKDPIYLVINSPGGSIDAGLEMISTLSGLRRPIHTVSLWAVSMGFQTVQGLGDRYILADGTLMSHKAYGGFRGEFPGQLNNRLEYWLKRVTRMDQKAADRTAGKHTLKSYQALVENEFWCDGQDCVNEGFADKVVSASCDKSLEGTRDVKLYEDVFMGHTIQLIGKYDLCPLNTNLLAYEILIDGEPLFKDNRKTKDGQTMSFAQQIAVYNDTDITKEELFEINRKVKDVLVRKAERTVIKGY